ncbi:MAG: ATP-binding protein [Chloroflexota bacterium]|nr:ATP-binding protein [Chloroflexota bacterium]
MVHQDVTALKEAELLKDEFIGRAAHEPRTPLAILKGFARADNAHAYGIGGTGLGLYLCRELVERQGGRIWFEAVEGKGSTLWIAFPLPSHTPPLC